MTSARLIYITCPDDILATDIAEALLNEKLIACANILPGMQSVYEWQGKVCSESEVVLILKTQEDRVPKIKEKVLALHSYACPCFVVLPVTDGSEAFLTWIQNQTSL